MKIKIYYIIGFLLLVSTVYGRVPGEEISCGDFTGSFCDNFNDASIDTSKWITMNNGVAKCVEENGYMWCKDMADTDNVFANWTKLATSTNTTYSFEIKFELNGTGHTSGAIWLEDSTPQWDQNYYCNIFHGGSRNIRCVDDGAGSGAWSGNNLTYRLEASAGSISAHYIYENGSYVWNSTNTAATGTDWSEGWHINGGGWKLHYYYYCDGYTNITMCMADQGPPIITPVYPEEDAYYGSYDGWLNFTTNENATCGVSNSDWVRNETFSTGLAHFYYNPNSLSEGNHSINISCWDATLNNRTTALNFGIDLTPPVITTNLGSNSTYWNNSIVLDVNVTDNNDLQSLMINDSCGYGYFNNSITSPFIYSTEINTVSCSVGLQQTNITACDSGGNCQTVRNYWYNTAKLRIRAKNTVGSAITNFTIFSNNVLQGSTTSGIFDFNNISAGNYNISIDAPGYENKSTIVTVSVAYHEYNFTLYTTNSISFEFRDENTSALVNNVTIELISELFSNNYTTSNGTLFVDLLTPNLYAMRYKSKDGYPEKFYYFNLQNRTHTNLTLYLVRDPTDVTATVYDEASRGLEDAYIKVLRYDLETNSYIVREIVKTNFEGVTTMKLKLNTEFYKFIIEYPLGTIKEVTSPTYIYETDLIFQINLGIETADNYFNTEGVNYKLYFNNDTNNFVFTYSDTNNVVSQGCLKIYKQTLLSNELYNSSCVPSSSASIVLNIVNESGAVYNAKAYFDFDETPEYFVTSDVKKYEEDTSAGKLGVLMIVFLSIIFLLIGYWDKEIALILFPLPMVFGSIINMVDISPAVTISIEIVCIIVAILISKYK